ncbi:hypothetical protein FE257_002502 [Aspergillus nanangensis]|uniref:N-(5-amino-5-carboxypentanoyl)-L-cysteinyl-D-valine synthase n=1 Tax=Aspergillus nanangensis TaxID=2582783 RepID=A0AAD4CSV2_ASPNN|nr:hypothetical protein FE257_002502 [Aspergillus nanangensis]
MAPPIESTALRAYEPIAVKKPVVTVVEEPVFLNGESRPGNGAIKADGMANASASCGLDATTLGRWKDAVGSISERCDLSGLSIQPTKYQLASTGMDQATLAVGRRTMSITNGALQNLKTVCTQRHLPPESVLLFAVHQMLKSYGNGSHTVTAALVRAAQEGTWNVVPTVLDQTHREQVLVQTALDEVASMWSPNTRHHQSPVTMHELVKSELMDLVIAFHQGDEPGQIPSTNFPLVLEVNLQETAWEFSVSYALSLFHIMAIDSFLGAIRTLLAIAAGGNATLIKDIELLPSEQESQLEEWNLTDGEYPTEKRLHHLIEDAASRCGSKVAVTCGGRDITYTTLNEQANCLAHYLRSMGIQSEQLIALFLDKDDRLITTLLGIWKSGAAYVPIDPAYPNDRVRFVLDDTQARVIIASERHVRRLQNEIVADRELWIIHQEPLLDLLAQKKTPENSGNLSHLPLTSKQLAYVTYTSGTTGFPKGIYKEHTSVVNSITDLSNRYGVVGGEEAILLFSAYVFEPFVRQMLMALVNGHPLAIINDEQKFDPDVLLPFIQKYRVTYLNGTASVLQEYDFSSCPSLKRMILVGENLTDVRYEALRRRFKGRIFNEYGFTESAFVTALKIFEPTSRRTDMSLGRPVRNVKCYILNPNLKRVPLGVIGELHIGGLGISRGYMNRAELTKERFLRNPYQTPRERELGINGLMYKTGDLARWLPTGDVEYLGRVDFQIKLRGIRIEPGEIESNMATYPGIRASLVVAKRLLSGGTETTQDHLVGYFVCDERQIPETDLLSFLETKLPRYMIPTRLIQLPQIPVTINGKADLRALPTVEVAVTTNGAVGRRDQMDATLAGIWGDVLDLSADHIGLDDNFFRLGGHSITCIQLIARVRHQLHAMLSVEDVFNTKILRDLADLLRTRQLDTLVDQDTPSAVVTLPPSEGDEVDGAYLANSLQQGFVYHALKNQQSDAYIMQSSINYHTHIDPHLYRAAWERVQQEHSALRLRFAWESEVIQMVDRDTRLDWREFDWTRVETTDQTEKFSEVRQKDYREPYDLGQGQLMRVYLFRRTDSSFTCLFSCHHAILDGWSLPLLFEYVHGTYISLLDGKPLPSVEGDAYRPSQEYLQNHRDDHLEFWTNYIGQIKERCDMNSLLNEASRYKVPLGEYDHIQQQKQQTIILPWDGQSVTDLRNKCSSQGLTLHSVLQLVWHLVLHSYGGGKYTVTGTTISGRNLPIPGIEHALGLFINTLPLVIDHESYEGKSVLEAIAEVQKQVNAMNSRSNVELGRLQKNNLKHGLFDTLFVLENYPVFETSQRDLHEQMLNYTIEGGTEKLSYPLAVVAQERGQDKDSCAFTVCYASELFADETIQEVLQMVRHTFANICENINTPIRDLEYISRDQLLQLDRWNATSAEFPSCTLQALFELEAHKNPNKTAVVYEDVRLSYQELNSRANAMAHRIRSLVHIRPNDLVALVTDKSEDMITSILAVWKTGGAYVPIDPGYPDDRIKYILEDTRALAVIADRKHLDRVGILANQSVHLIPSDVSQTLPPSHQHPESACTAWDLAYVIYTSGTTGKPKGVMVEHHGVVNLATSLSKIFCLRDTDDEVILSFSNYVFDHFVEQMTDALLNGQTLLVLNDDMRGDKERLYRYIETNRVTYLSGTPSVVSMYEFDRFRAHLRRIDCVGEAFSEAVFDKIRETSSTLIINGYGPTETSITTHKRLYPFPERRTDKSIGCQVANSTTYVLNDDMKRVPIGAVGELYLGGDGVARGYHNRPDLTEERFPLNPFQTEQERREHRNGRLYKTGDLVRWIPGTDGEIEYLGRNDFQVKIRGLRIELGEIESVLSLYDEIEQSVVVCKDRSSDGEKYLVGYYVSSGAVSTQAIRRFMQARLPDYMIPTRLMRIPKFPVTISGKLDTKALPPAEEDSNDDVVGPRTEIERTLARIWGEVLGIAPDSISIYGDFFSLGGDSLKSTKLSFAVSKALDVAVSVSTLFCHSTIEALAYWIISGSTESADIVPVKMDALEDIPVSAAQERLLFIDEFDSGTSAYNIAMHVQLAESTCLTSLERAVRSVISRHEALRTVLVRSKKTSRYSQRILSTQEAHGLFSFQTMTAGTESNMLSQMIHAASHVFSLGYELPVRLTVHQLEGRCFASLVFHHSAFDAWSWDIFQHDLVAYYTMYQGTDTGLTSLPKLRAQYKEYSLRHRQVLSSGRRQSLADFWSNRLSGVEQLQLLPDNPRPARFDYAGNDLSFQLDTETTAQIKRLAQSEGASLYTLLLAAFCHMLHLYTSQTDILVGIPVAHRTHPDFESVIGFFVNLLPLRVQVTNQTIRELIAAVQAELVDVQIHQDMPFQEITKILHVEHDPSRHPLVQTIFNWEQEGSAGTLLFNDYQPLSSQPSVAKFDLNVTVKEAKDKISVNFNYATTLFNESTIRSLQQTYQALLVQIARGSASTVMSTLLPLVEQPASNDQLEIMPVQSTCQAFERQAASHPNSIAVVAGANRISYSELNTRANRLAHWIASLTSINPDDRICLLLEQGIDRIVCIMAVWKAGAAYVPIDPSYPAERIQFMMQDSGAKVLLSSSSCAPDKILQGDTKLVLMDSPETASVLAQQPSENPGRAIQPSNLAYVIFTSGTTGEPKGVLIEHRSVLQLCNALVHRYFGGFTSQQAVLMLSNYVFDFSVEQLVLSILAGNKLLIPPTEGVTHEEFYHLANAEKLTYLSGTPSLLQQIQFPRLQHLQTVTSAGEELHLAQYQNMRAQFSGLINNAYGITETTVYNIVTSFDQHSPFTKSLRDVLPGARVYVLNDRLQPVPIHAVGELYITGVCLGRGYLNRESLTSDRFVSNPFAAEDGSSAAEYTRLYKTGDMVRYRGLGQLEYLGRRDQQVKLRGFRIEVSEVQEALSSIPEVMVAAVVPKYANKENDSFSRIITGLVGYYTLDDAANIMPSSIMDKLTDLLPSYMIPSELHPVQGPMPVTVNGKLDVQRLAAVSTRGANQRQEYTAPRDLLEVKLCRLWASLLDMDHCGIDSDLFVLGGDSISSLQLVGDIHRQLGLKVTVKDIFRHRTVRALHENVLTQDMGHEQLPSLRADQGLVEGDAPLLPIQQWFLSKQLERPGYWNHAFTIRTPSLDVDRLRAAVYTLQKRHDILRMRLRREGDQYFQTFAPDGVPVNMRELNISPLRDAHEVNEIFSEWQSHFDLQHGPLFAVAYLNGYEDGSARIWFALHHLIVDTVSWNIILSDLQALYHGEDLGMKSSSVQQWALALRKYAMSSTEVEYWNDLDAKTSRMGGSLPAPAAVSGKCQRRLTEHSTVSLRHCCSRLSVSVHDVLLMAVGSALQKVLGNSSSVVTVEGHGREEAVDTSLDVSRTVGWFTSLYPFEIPQITDHDLVQGVLDVKQAVSQIPNNGIGYGILHGYKDGGMPAVSVNYLGRLDQVGSRSGDWKLSPFEYDQGLITSQNDADKSSSMLDITFAIMNNQMNIDITSRWEDGVIQELANIIESSLSDISANGDAVPGPLVPEFTPYFTFGDTGRGPPIFMLPPGEGGAESYFNNIVSGLPQRNLVVFNNHYRHYGSLRTFEELADYYISQIQQIQPHGPYHLLGWSFGGILGLEIASRLTSKNEQIQTLALIDPYFDIPSASQAIGLGGVELLDSIYYTYRPGPGRFESLQLQSSLDRVILFKASMTNERFGTEGQKRLYEWYAQSPMNNLERFVAADRVEVVPMSGSHFTWVHDQDQRHDRSHTKEKPFICTRCPKSFTRKDLLARHERLAHSSPSTHVGQTSSTSPPPPSSHQVLDGLNMLASAVTDYPAVTASPVTQAEQQLLSSSQAFTPRLTPTATGPPNTAPVAPSGYSEPFSGFGPSTSYDGDDFTSFLDSIPLPSHPYSPSYQPLPLFPAFNFDTQPVYDQSAQREQAPENIANPSSSVLPRHGTQLPSLQPEDSHTPYKGRQPRSSISVTTQCRDRIVACLADYANVILNPFIPSRHALSRCLTGYLTGFHDHYPFKHIPTFSVDTLPLHLFLCMAALGAQYCREPDTCMNLYQVAKVVTMEHIRREFQWMQNTTNAASSKPSRSPEVQDQDIIESVQSVLMLVSVSSWFENDPPYYEALYIRSFMETLLRKGGLNDLPSQDGSWRSWIRSEEYKRTKLVVFCFFNIHTIVFDLPPMILTEEITLDLPCTEKEWQVNNEEQWLTERSLSREEPKLQDALCSLFAHGSGSKSRLESFSSMGGYVLIHAILQNIWLIQKACRLPGLNRDMLLASEITSLEQALEQWCQCWEHNQESSIDPFNPHGPLSFTSTALLRLAYIRLNADFSAARRLQTWRPEQVARSLKDNLTVQRSDRLTRAALHCAHALSTPIKLGISFVAHTQVVSWSNQYALCSLECAVLLAKWLEVATVTSPAPHLTEQESKLLEFVIEMVMEAQHGVSREWLLANNTRLSAVVTRLWARLFTADYIWELVNLIGRSLNSYADILDSMN